MMLTQLLHFWRGWAACAVFVACNCCPATLLAGPVSAGESQCITYAKPDGESFFALSLQLAVERASEEPRTTVILFDTSASQIGAHREKALAVLTGVLAGLRPNDRVHLLAIDIDPVTLTPDFVSPAGPEMQAAMAKLKARTPLGATDLPAALDAALTLFAHQPPQAERAVLYIGDGMSAAHLLAPKALEKLCRQLLEARVPVNSYAVGPRLDNQLLGTLANHSGGVVAVDYGDIAEKKYAQYLVNAIRAEVFWPKEVKLPPQVVEFLPEVFPPLRTDRDSVIIGRGKLDKPFPVVISFQGGTNPVLRWEVTPKAPDEVHAFLAELVATSKKTRGWMLPLAGAAGLVEARLSLNADLRKVVVLARQALAMNTLDQAEQLGRKALELDASSPDAQSIMIVLKQRYVDAAKQAIEKKQFENASHLLLKALKLDPQHKEASELLAKLPVLSAPGGAATPAGQAPGKVPANPNAPLIIKKPQ